jgi:hypothetical protein
MVVRKRTPQAAPENNNELYSAIKNIKSQCPLDWGKILDYIYTEAKLPNMSHQMLDSEVAKITFERQGIRKIYQLLEKE